MSKPTASDVARAFLTIDKMTPKKLQKLCYYAQGWYLALNDEELFSEDFQAWIHGPVIPGLYHDYKDSGWDFIPQETSEDVSEELMEFVTEVYRVYGHLTGDQLERLSHSESPWKIARNGKKPWEAHSGVITKESMKQYFRSVYEQAENKQ